MSGTKFALGLALAFIECGGTMQSSKKSLSAIEDLKKDASQVVENLADLSKRLASVGKSKTEEMSKELAVRFEDDVEKLKKQVEVLNRDASKLAKRLGGHVRKNPYLYVVGALAMGALVGKLSSPRVRP